MFGPGRNGSSDDPSLSLEAPTGNGIEPVNPLRRHYPVHTLDGELLLEAGTALTAETLEEVASRMSPQDALRTRSALILPGETCRKEGSAIDRRAETDVHPAG
jgi:hypothetical protein